MFREKWRLRSHLLELCRRLQLQLQRRLPTDERQERLQMSVNMLAIVFVGVVNVVLQLQYIRTRPTVRNASFITFPVVYGIAPQTNCM